MVGRDEIADFLRQVAGIIADTFGSKCEVMLCELGGEQARILALHNCHFAGAAVGGDVPAYALKRIASTEGGFASNLRDVRGGKTIKSAVALFEDEGVSLALSVSYDCTDLDRIRQAIAEFMSVPGDERSARGGGVSAPVIEDALEEASALVGKSVRAMNKKDRMQVIEYLESRGIMRIQKSVQTVARYLGISRYTVYNYLNELNPQRRS